MPSVRDIKRALQRLRSALPEKKKLADDYRNIRLGLERIRRVVPDEQRWIGVHVGGTNGKGSICALLAGLMRRSGISHGTFMSPAIPERHNGITINGLYINRRMHNVELAEAQTIYNRVSTGWAYTMPEDPGDLTPFELETATAFRIFNKMHIKYGIVEVGMGGATDATNAMKEKAVTVISKIDLDHQEYLGNSIEEIARIKAGIMRPGVTCIVDHTNPSSVIDILREHASSVGTQIITSAKGLPLLESLDHKRFPLEDYEKQNLLCAIVAFQHLLPDVDIDINKLMAYRPYLPGRKDRVSVSGLTGGTREAPVVVDGAHNMLGVEALVKYVDGKLRQDHEPVTWVMALSAGGAKPFSTMIETLLRPQDNLAFVEYARGPNDPTAAPADIGRSIAREVLKDDSRLYDGEAEIASAMRWACVKAGEGPLVVTGSLYLIRELFKLEGVEPRRQIGMRRPGRAQLWYYVQLSQQRELTAEEAHEFKQARRHFYLDPSRNPTFTALKYGGKPRPLVVPERVRQLQRAASFHKKQADGYRSAMESIETDEEAAWMGERGKTAASGTGLGQSVEELKRRHGEHLKAYHRAMYKIRGYEVDPEMKYLSHEEIFGWPNRSRGRIASLLHKYKVVEGDKAEGAAEVAEKLARDAELETGASTGKAAQDSERKGGGALTTRRAVPQDDDEAQPSGDKAEEEGSGRKRKSRFSNQMLGPEGEADEAAASGGRKRKSRFSDQMHPPPESEADEAPPQVAPAPKRRTGPPPSPAETQNIMDKMKKGRRE